MEGTKLHIEAGYHSDCHNFNIMVSLSEKQMTLFTMCDLSILDISGFGQTLATYGFQPGFPTFRCYSAYEIPSRCWLFFEPLVVMGHFLW